jgi:hypothetical protein
MSSRLNPHRTDRVISLTVDHQHAAEITPAYSDRGAFRGGCGRRRNLRRR